jgi:hypothetical protein
MSDWSVVRQKDIEKTFDEMFDPELLYGYQAIVYDDALTKANHFGTNWKKEMQKDEVLNTFMCDFLEQEGVSVNDFITS